MNRAEPVLLEAVVVSAIDADLGPKQPDESLATGSKFNRRPDDRGPGHDVLLIKLIREQ